MAARRDELHSGLPAFPLLEPPRMHGDSAAIFLVFRRQAAKKPFSTGASPGFAETPHLSLAPTAVRVFFFGRNCAG
jgi:hypothetical protein